MKKVKVKEKEVPEIDEIKQLSKAMTQFVVIGLGSMGKRRIRLLKEYIKENDADGKYRDKEEPVCTCDEFAQ